MSKQVVESFKNLQFFIGFVEDIEDPLKLGRARVRALGTHSIDETAVPTDSLPWAWPVNGVFSPSMDGKGISPSWLMIGTSVLGIWIDGDQCQQPVVLGSLAGWKGWPDEGESDINRLARNDENQEHEIVQKKKDEIVTVPIAKSAGKGGGLLGTITGAATGDIFGNILGPTIGSAIGTISEDVVTLVGEVDTFIGKDLFRANTNIRALDSYEAIGNAVTSIPSKKEIIDTITGEISSTYGILKGDDTENELIGVGGYNQLGEVAVDRIDTFNRIEETKDSILSETNIEFLDDVRNSVNTDVTKYVDRAYEIYGTGGAEPLSDKGEFLDSVLNYVGGKKDSISENVVKNIGINSIGENLNSDFSTVSSLISDFSGTSGMSKEEINLKISDLVNENIPTSNNNIIRRLYSNYLPTDITNTFQGFVPEVSEEVPSAFETLEEQNEGREERAQESSGSTWKEPETPYEALYPFNHVVETEKGHIIEIDDTPEKERLHKYHKSGTFEEIHPDGTTVTKIVKDNYKIIAGDDYCNIVGTCNITIEGDANLLVKGNFVQEVEGNYDLTVKGNKTEAIGQNKTLCVNQLSSETVLAAKTVSVAAAHTLSVGGARNETIGGVDNLIVGGAKAISVGGAIKETVGGAKTTTVGGLLKETVGALKKVTIGGTLTVSSRLNDFKGSIQCNKDVKAGRISLKKHKHGGVKKGGSKTRKPS